MNAIHTLSMGYRWSSGIVFVSLCLLVFTAAAQTNSDLFERQKTGLFVIQSVDVISGNKTSVGSGFRLSEDGLLASNYHVVSDHVLHPDDFELQLVDSNDQRGEIEVVAVDVVNDLALLKITKMLELDDDAVSEVSDNSVVAGGTTVITSTHMSDEEVEELTPAIVLDKTDIKQLGDDVSIADLLGKLEGPQALEEELAAKRQWIFELSYELPQQGDDVIALGNPYDIGLSLVPGIFNGVTSKGFKKHIHFTGALNPGMSGGPAVDKDGKVVGINVAGAGNSVSFLVPVEKLVTLVDDYQSGAVAGHSMHEHINTELLAQQNQLFDDLLSDDWELEAFGPLMVPMQIRDYVDCSASTTGSEDNLLYEFHSSDCGVHDRIFLSRNFDTGTVEFDYGWYKSDQLNTFQFYKIMESLTFSPFNITSRDDVTTFACHQDVQQFPALDPTPFQSTFCVRTYVDYDGLYDVLFYAKSLLNRSEGVYLHYTLAGVSKEKADAFNQRFVESVQWK